MFETNIELLKNNRYPGRLIVMGWDETREKFVQVYAIMGRSENSRNRIFVMENGVLKTKAFDESKVQDPSLIIYEAMVQSGSFHVVSNGVQTKDIAQKLNSQMDFFDTLTNWNYEPDEPNWTPRISGYFDTKTKRAALSIIKKSGDATERLVFEIENEPRCIHTYKEDGNPLPSFEDEPYMVPLEGSAKEIAQFYWDILNEENKVALAVKVIDPKTDTFEMEIINKLK